MHKFMLWDILINTVFLRSTTDTSLESKLCGKEAQGTKPDAVEETPIKLKARGDT